MISKEYYDTKLNEIPKDFLDGAVNCLREELSSDDKEQIVQLYKDKGVEWAVPHHFFWGMSIRNLLREKGFLDEVLPDKNWDDYYVQVVELACGIR